MSKQRRVKEPSPEELRRIATNSKVRECDDIRSIYENAMLHKYGCIPLKEQNENDIKAIMVNNIRHSMTTYDADLKKVNRTNSRNAYTIYKNTLLNKIAKQYPFLESACRYQKYRVYMVENVK